MRARHKISRAGIELIKSFEGYRQVAARLPDGRWTIGYGHTRLARQGATVSEADAEALLLFDLAPISEAVSAACLTDLSQNQFDALVSFAFNVGLSTFRDSIVLEKVNAGRLTEAAIALDAWRRSEFEGQSFIVDPLIRRRAAEKALFLSDESPRQFAPSSLIRPAPDPKLIDASPQVEPAQLLTSVEGDEIRIALAGEPEPEPDLHPVASSEGLIEANLIVAADDLDAIAAPEAATVEVAISDPETLPSEAEATTEAPEPLVQNETEVSAPEPEPVAVETETEAALLKQNADDTAYAWTPRDAAAEAVSPSPAAPAKSEPSSSALRRAPPPAIGASGMARSLYSPYPALSGALLLSPKTPDLSPPSPPPPAPLPEPEPQIAEEPPAVLPDPRPARPIIATVSSQDVIPEVLVARDPTPLVRPEPVSELRLTPPTELLQSLPPRQQVQTSFDEDWELEQSQAPRIIHHETLDAHGAASDKKDVVAWTGVAVVGGMGFVIAVIALMRGHDGSLVQPQGLFSLSNIAILGAFVGAACLTSSVYVLLKRIGGVTD